MWKQIPFTLQNTMETKHMKRFPKRSHSLRNGRGAGLRKWSNSELMNQS